MHQERKKLPEVHTLREYFRYDPANGHLIWLKNTGNRMTVGDRAGSAKRKCKKGKLGEYRNISFFGETYAEHRIVWKICKGEEPPYILDHINRNPSDNRIENLRQLTHTENTWNHSSYSTNKSGYSGVYWDAPRNMWRVEMWSRGKRLRAGRYPCKICAIFASKKLNKERIASGTNGENNSDELALDVMRLEKKIEILKIENESLRKALGATKPREDTHAKNSESIL